jgi:glycosyltransferase involved in cell wall biosynthesis
MTDVAPVSLCMIVKNEAASIGPCLDSVRPYIKEICIVDTGSTDGTLDIIKKYTDRVEVFTECNNKDGLIESFSMARQRSYELGTQPWTIWMDGDDTIRNADRIPSLIEKYDRERCGQPALVVLPYEYSHDEYGNVTCYHYRERLTTPRGKFQWRGPVHEVLTPDVPGTMNFQTDEVTYIHHRDKSGKKIEQGRNLRILKAHYERSGESDVRMLYYLGLEYGYARDYGSAIKFHKRYLELSGWDDERFHACLRIAEHYQDMGSYDDALQWGLKSLTIREGWGEGYFNIGKSYYYMAQRGGPDHRRNWERSIHFFRQGLACPPTKTILFTNPLERSYDVHKFLNFALNITGDVKGAAESANIALRAKPNDEGLKSNKRLYDIHNFKVQITESLKKLIECGELKVEAERRIQDILSGKIKPDDPILVRKRIVNRKPGSLDIVFYVGFSCERWNPETAKKNGIGGSETAVIEMAKRLAAKGHTVRVFGDCNDARATGGVFDGVEYIHYESFKDIECDILISSRRPHIVDDGFNTRAKVTLCWVHDVWVPDLTHARALRFDKFLCLSNWHRSFMLGYHKFIHPDQVMVTRNGIDLDKFRPSDKFPVTRNSHRAVYSSSPDRGLEIAIRTWPRIRQQVPDAELHVYYGFENWEMCARQVNDVKQLGRIASIRDQLNSAKDYGVQFHGRVNQEELAREFKRSGVWAYPTWFHETSCITAMEAQAAGLEIVTSPLAALNETVGSRGVMINGDPNSDEYASSFVEAVVKAMLNDNVERRISLQNYAFDNFGWDKLADEWNGMLINITKEVEKNVMPPYQRAV